MSRHLTQKMKLDRLFIDKASGRDINRSQLEALIAYAYDGDTIFVLSEEKLIRNAVDLKSVVN
ncbi:recombinase family protein [Legionella gresilensis]|uniref:recombinase family protein n=1 Tax=Legionella gresilensis TaxID=91823 RepID=UPI001041818B|nr:recombinase family protein [Legionella gresilensis]